MPTPWDRCENCQLQGEKVYFFGLINDDSGPRNPNSGRVQINSISNVHKNAGNCAVCAVLLQIISSSTYPRGSQQLGSARNHDTLFLDCQRKDYALCGIHWGKDEAHFDVDYCLHVTTADRGFRDKIVLISSTDGSNMRKLPLFAKLLEVGEHVNFDALRDWLGSCLNHHEDTCRSKPVKIEDLQFKQRQRVIDVATQTIVHVDLSEARYATITYVWGSEFTPNLEATEGNDISTKRLPAKLPRTFSDALTVCKELQIPYLWIDAYCIDQLDPIDKEIQISNMDTIYWASVVTLVAIEGNSPSYGLPGVSSPRISSQYGEAFEFQDARLSIVPGFAPTGRTWNTRAWTLQEALLSNRLLVFNEHYVSFYCAGGAMREDFAHINDDPIRHGQNWESMSKWEANSGSPFTRNFRKGVFDMTKYCDMVNLYATRYMSNPLDALNAVSGLLRHWTRTDKSKFIAGLPTEFISDALFWVGSDHRPRGNLELPTWSWATWQGDIRYPCAPCEMSRQKSNQIKESYREIEDQYKLFKLRFLELKGSGTTDWGDVAELEAPIKIINKPPGMPKLLVQSYTAKFQLPVMTKNEYANGPKHNRIVLVEDKNTISIVTEEVFGIHEWIELPKSLSLEQKSSLFSHGAEFLLLKYWYDTTWGSGGPPLLEQVWTLLISRCGDTAELLGCMIMSPETWESGSPKPDTVTLV